MFCVKSDRKDSKSCRLLRMRKGVMKDGEYPKVNSKNVFNFRLVTNIKDFEFKESLLEMNVIDNKSEKIFLDKDMCKRNFFLNGFLSHVKKSLDNMKIQIRHIDDKSLPEIDVLFYIHGGGFISQTTESCVGFLSE